MNSLSKFISHYMKRSQELGLEETLKRAWFRAVNPISLWGQSLWWGWVARRQMSDTAFIAKTTGDWHSIEDFLEHLACRSTSSWLLPYESKQKTIQLLNRFYPKYVSEVLTAADAVCRNEFSLLGQGFCFPEGIDWHRDPITNWRWPTRHRSCMDRYLYIESSTPDPILLWELNRHQHFITLGIAYWLTGNQRYLDTFCSQAQNWIETNPLQHGLNWFYPLEVSVRLIAWTVALQFFCNAPLFKKRIGKIFFKSLWQQIDFLTSHLQIKREDVPNNHMISELVGMIVAGTIFPEFRKAKEWREKGVQFLIQQITAQTHSDGVNKEQATGYHRFVTELLMLVVIQSRHGKLPQNPSLENALEQMLDYVFFSLSPDGTAPLWGDSDYGQALSLRQKRDFWDFRPMLSAGTALYDRPDWKFLADHFDVEAFWLLGKQGLDHWKEIKSQTPKKTSCAFPAAGQYIIRDSWTAKTDVAFFRCGPFGLGGEGHCAHAHNDLLSFMLWVGGKPLLVDSGTYTYHGALRDHFRLTSAHNTVMVDDLELAIPVPNFNWYQIPHSICVEWTGKRVAGALSYVNQVDFIRELSHPKAGCWEVMDNFIGSGDFHKLIWFFHFAEDLDLHWDKFSENLIVKKECKPYIVVLPPKDVSVVIKSDWVSRYYGAKESASVLQATWNGRIPSRKISFEWKFSSFGK